MGLRKRKPIYITDRGDQHDLDKMEVSHLLNAINHHNTQIDTIDRIIAVNIDSCVDLNNVYRRRIDLSQTIGALIIELCKRDPDDDRDSPLY